MPFRHGDRAALEAVYRHYVRLVETVVTQGTYVAGSRVFIGDVEQRKDLLQDIFARAFSERARLGFDGLREYRPYLLTLARNVMIDWARKRKETLPGDIDALVEQYAPADAPVAEMPPWSDPATMQLVERYLQGLTEPTRRLHALRYEQGLSQDDAARTLGLSRQNVRTLEQKLRQGLADALGAAAANQARAKAVG